MCIVPVDCRLLKADAAVLRQEKKALQGEFEQARDQIATLEARLTNEVCFAYEQWICSVTHGPTSLHTHAATYTITTTSLSRSLALFSYDCGTRTHWIVEASGPSEHHLDKMFFVRPAV